MSMQRWIQRTVPLAAAAVVGVAPMAFAQWGRTQTQTQSRGQELFEWSGRVDREVQIVMRGNQVSTRNMSNTEAGRARSRVMMQLPRQSGEVFAQLEDGRGTVDVIQQPTAQNGYTTVVRVTDRSGGADSYRVVAYWENYANGDYVGNGARGRGRGRAVGQNRDRDRDANRDRDNDDYDRNGYPNRDRNGVYGNGQYNNQAMMHWSGNVDGELEIRIQNGRVDYRNLSGAQPTSIRVDRGNVSVPRNASQVYVSEAQGRGSVTVVQQPSSWNGYMTVIRVRDPQGGYGYYDFDLVWR